MTIQDATTVLLTKKELATLANALNEVMNGPEAIEDWEFSTRMGVERPEAGQLVMKLNELLTSFEDTSSQ